MNKRIALVVADAPNPWFRVLVEDELGGQTCVADGPSLERALHTAVRMLGYPLVLPLCGPDTAL